VKKIAKQADVIISKISRVLNNHHNFPKKDNHAGREERNVWGHAQEAFKIGYPPLLLSRP
jgi:hypothetical protein